MTPHALIAPARLAGAPLLRTQTDERLVDLVRAGNPGAFEAIVARYRRPLLRYCAGIVGEPRAEDVLQQSFLRAYDALRASHGEMNLRPWLYRIAHNQSLNALRDRSLGHEELSEAIDGVERPDQAYEKSERLRDVIAAVSVLPGRQRDAIVLRELEGRSYEEIAAELGVTDGAVRQLLNRARGTLRAGMSAVVPFGLLARMPWAVGPGSEPMGARVAELCTAGAGGALATKVCATALVTGAVMGGVATAPSGGPDDGRASADGASVEQPREHSEEDDATSGGRRGAGPAKRAGPGERRGRGRGRGRGGDGDRSGPGGGDRDDDRSGRRDGEDRDEDRSGSGGGDSDGDDDRSGDRSASGGGGDDDLADADNSSSGGGDNRGSGSGSSGSGSSGGGSGSSGGDSLNSGSGSLSSGSGSGGDLVEGDSSGSGSGDD